MMADGKGDWDALRRVFSNLDAPDLPSAPSSGADHVPNDSELARDLAIERAAILEHCAGLSRREAEKRACEYFGLTSLY